MTKAVIFDCDGVLIDSEIIAVEVEMALLAGHGLGYETAEFKTRFMGMSDKAFHADGASDTSSPLYVVGARTAVTAQIQGVWTPPALRGRGYATRALASTYWGAVACAV